MSERRVPIGTPDMPGLVLPGEDVVFIGCAGHQWGPDAAVVYCTEQAVPCSVAAYGTMEFRGIAPPGSVAAGLATVEIDDGRFEFFEPAQLSSPELVARYAVRAARAAQALG